MLYDKAFIKQLPEVKQFENPWLVGICKMEHNKELRELIEKWYLHIPEADRPKLETKLKSLKDEDFIPAVYELAIHQFCIEEGWKVEYEPTLPNGFTPDLRVTLKDGKQFILDATSIFDNADYVKANNKKIELTHKISAISTKLILSLHYLRLPDPDAKPKLVINQITKWLEQLPNDNKKHKKTFDVGGYSIEVETEPKAPKPKGGCVYSVMDPGMSVPDYSRRIKSVLDDKRRKYSSKDTGMPLVVMVADAIGRIRADETTIDRTLFGQYQISFTIGDTSGSSRMERDRSGYFVPSNDENGNWIGKNTGVSAVMYASVKEKGSFQMQLFHNPVPHIPLDPAIFEKMPQLLVFTEKPSLTMRWAVTNPEQSRIHFS